MIISGVEAVGAWESATQVGLGRCCVITTNNRVNPLGLLELSRALTSSFLLVPTLGRQGTVVGKLAEFNKKFISTPDDAVKSCIELGLEFGKRYQTNERYYYLCASSGNPSHDFAVGLYSMGIKEWADEQAVVQSLTTLVSAISSIKPVRIN